MSEVMWVWDYELKTLGSWPSTGYNGHNTPVEVVTQMDVKAIRAERDRLREALVKCRRELWHCNEQLKYKGATEGFSVTEALCEAGAALTPAGGGKE